MYFIRESLTDDNSIVIKIRTVYFIYYSQFKLKISLLFMTKHAGFITHLILNVTKINDLER